MSTEAPPEHHKLIPREHYHVDTLGHIAERLCLCSLPRRYVCAACVDGRAHPSTNSQPTPEQIVYNVAQRDSGFRKHLIEQLTAMGDKQDTGPLKTFILTLRAKK